VLLAHSPHWITRRDIVFSGWKSLMASRDRVGLGGLSGSFFRHGIDIAEDHIATEAEDQWNRGVLGLIIAGDTEALQALWPEYAKQARVDMGFKHMSFLLGALGNSYSAANPLACSPLYGTRAAVIHFSP
jgi:2-aminophenol/2-amino-5-chlorophenol 1,6-dioxygenase alpha subunit